MSTHTNNKGGISLNWRHFTNLWTIFVYIILLWDFFLDNSLADVVSPVLAIYTAILALFSAEKEFERWYEFHNGRHVGERYVLFWTILIVFMLVVDAIFQKSYKMEPEIIATYIVVIGILAITKKSKKLYTSFHRKE